MWTAEEEMKEERASFSVFTQPLEPVSDLMGYICTSEGKMGGACFLPRGCLPSSSLQPQTRGTLV